MQFKTISGSLYEVDQENKQIRRLNGTNDPSPRQGKDGDFRKYSEISSIEIEKPVLICWIKEETPLLSGSPEYAVPTTLTSLVEKIIK